MITKHKYEVAKFGNALGANKKPVTSTVEVAVLYPDHLLGFAGVDAKRYASLLSKVDDAEFTEDVRAGFAKELVEMDARLARVAKILAGFVSAHHVQSKLKGAYTCEPKDRTAGQLELIRQVEAKLELDGVSFIPDERSAKRKDDKTVEALRAGWPKLDDERKEKLCVRWGFDGGDDTVEAYVGAYWAWVDAEKAKREKENLDSLGLGE